MYTFYNIPVPIDSTEYEDQTREAIDLMIREVPDVVAIYSMWEQDLYGLSDIDFLCVIKENTKQKEQIIIDISKKFSLLDIPHCIDAKDVEQLQYFIQRPFLKHLWWTEYEIEPLAHEAKLIFAWKLCFIGLLRIFYPAWYTKKISVELLLKQIYYLRYLINFLDIDDPSILRFMDDYSKFRRTWFQHQDTSLLVGKYLPKAMDISWKMIELVDKKLAQSGFVDKNQKSNTLSWRYPTYFCSVNQRANTELYYNTLRKNDRFLCLPSSFDKATWNDKWKQELEKITQLDPWFTSFDFSSTVLNGLLLLKKWIDSILLCYYKNFLLWER